MEISSEVIVCKTKQANVPVTMESGASKTHSLCKDKKQRVWSFAIHLRNSTLNFLRYNEKKCELHR